MDLDRGVLNLMPLLQLRRLLTLALMPVRPREEFRQDLYWQLMEDAARMHRDPRHAGIQVLRGSIPKPGRREMIIGAVLGSAVSLAGLIALVIRMLSNGKEERRVPAA